MVEKSIRLYNIIHIVPLAKALNTTTRSIFNAGHNFMI